MTRGGTTLSAAKGVADAGDSSTTPFAQGSGTCHPNRQQVSQA